MTAWSITFSVACVLWGWSLAWAMKRIGELLRAVDDAREEGAYWRRRYNELWTSYVHKRAPEEPADPEELEDLGEHFESLLNDRP